MFRSLATLTAAMALISAPAPRDAAPRPITQSESMLALYVEDHGRAPGGQDRSALILAIWPDGQAVWSEDGITGGPPYRTGQVDADGLKSLHEQIVLDGAFDMPELSRSRFGPDSRFTTLLVKSGGKSLAMQSWHELFEEGGKIVVGDHGARALEVQLRLAALKEEPAEYLFYRFVWSELQSRMLRLLPDESQTIEGEFVRSHDGVAWRESDSNR